MDLTPPLNKNSLKPDMNESRAEDCLISKRNLQESGRLLVNLVCGLFPPEQWWIRGSGRFEVKRTLGLA